MKKVYKRIIGVKSVVLLALVVLGSFAASGQNVYSGGSGNYDAITWYLSPTRMGLTFIGTPGAGQTLNIGNGHAVTIVNGATNLNLSFAGLVIHDTGASGSLTVGSANPNTNTSLTISGDITVNSTGTFTVIGNGTGLNTHTMSVGGDITNNNIFNMFNNVNDKIDVTLTGGGKTLSGTGTIFTFNILRNNTGANVNVNNSISVISQLDFATNGLFILNATSSVTIGSAAINGTIINNNGTNRYFQLDGTTGSGSQLIKTNTGSTASWQILFPIGTVAGGYTPLDLTAGSGAVVANAPTAGSTLAVKTIQNTSIQGQMRRQFRLAVSGNLVTTTTIQNADFYYHVTNDLSSGDVIGNYNTNWFLSVASGTWLNNTGGIAPGGGMFTAPGTAQTLRNGTYFYAIGSAAAFTNVWYSYQTGEWSDPDVWTLDPSGTSLNNPLSQPPSAGDQVVILNGFTVTSDVNNLTMSTTTIQGGAVLDMVQTTGHTLGAVTGSGLLRINGVALPNGTYDAFVATTGGTIEYYNTGGTLPDGPIVSGVPTYNKLLFTNSTGANITYLMLSNLLVNGTFDLSTTGAGTVTWQINNNTAAQRTITLTGDLTVGAGGRITVGTGNEGTLTSGTVATPEHSLTMFGNFINNGIVQFFDATDVELSAADYGETTTATNNIYTNELQGNAVRVIFRGPTDNIITCNNTTDFYRLIVDKGTGQQALLTLTSSGANNMRLFGPANLGGTSSPSDNSLSIQNGTLVLQGTLTIPILCVNGPGIAGNDALIIPSSGGLWINGANVNITVADNTNTNDDQRILVNGLLRISAGTYTAGYSRGVGSGTGGTLLVEGGTLSAWQYRPLLGSTNVSYIQTGGVVNIGTTGYNSTAVTSGMTDSPGTASYARFSIPSPTSTFQMSGGVLNIGRPSQNTELTNAQGIDIQTSIGNSSVTGGTINAYIPSTGYSFGINTSAPLYNLAIYREGTGAALTATLRQATTILNNLTIVTGNSPTLNCSGNDLTIGGNFHNQATTTFTPGAGTITFNGSGAQAWTFDGTITSVARVVMNKATGTVLTLGGAGVLPDITAVLTLTSGILNDGGETVTVSGTGILTNNATHTGTGVINYTSTAATIGGNNGTFGNLTITTNATIATNGAQTVTGTLRLINANSTLNIGSNALTALGNIYSNGTTGTAFTATKRIQTSGLHNAGGLTRQGASGVLLFPVGTGTLYTPNSIEVTATTHGTITVRPVNSQHPNVTATGQSVRYYWRVTSSGYAGITAVSHSAYNYSSATEDNPTANYRSARFDRTALTWGTNNNTFNANTSPPIPTFNTGTAWTGVTGTQLDGEYTCGNLTAFGTVTVYYSRGGGNWNANATWSTDNALKHTGAAAASNPTSCATCPVVIGNGAGINHIVTTVAASSCGSLTLNAGSTLNCSTFTGHNFGTSTGGSVSGTGTLRIGAVGAGVANMFPAGDFTNFLGANGGTVEWYGATKTIPAVGPAPQALSLSTYNNLVINPSAGNTITLPASNLTIYNDFTVGDAATFTGTALTNGSRIITVSEDFSVTRGTFNFSNANPSVTTLTVGDSTSIANGATMAVVGGGTANTNTLTTPGSIINNGTINFNNNSMVNITMIGSNNVIFGGSGSGGTTLRLLTVNKGNSQTPTVDFSVGGAVTAAISGWLTLTNGTFNWNNGSAVTISSTGAAYTIPPTARLKVSLGTVNVLTANSSAADLLLSGTLEVAGGTTNIGAPATTIDNDIEYASAGLPTIIVSGGTLNVNGSIRRPITTLSGALVYNQTGGAVTVGGEASNDTRGVFEIDANAGSSFTLTGTSTLTVQRQTNGTEYADVFINPETSNVSPTSTIAVGLTTATTQANLRVSIAPTIGNFTVLNGNGTNIQTVNLFSNPMILGGTLSIQSPSRLVTNSLDVTIAGDLNITGTGIYTSGTNTTTFNGTGPQAGALSAGSTFTNMTIDKAAGTILTLSGTSPTITNLNILNGVINVGALNLTVIGNIVNNSSQTGTGTIQLAGVAAVTTHNITSSGGSFTNLTLTGAASTKTVNATGNMIILGALNFATGNRYLNIGSGLLTFGTTSSVTGVGNTAFVRTNGSDSDLGVIKNWAVGAGTFTYPIGTGTNYTPVTFNLTVTTAGDLNVIPVNDRHPTANPSGEQILNYYWIINRGSLVYSATGSHVYGFPTALLGGSGGTLRAGYLDIASATPGWITTGHGGTANTTSMTFTNLLGTNLPTAGSTFHYSVGTNTSTTLATLPNPIIPVYSRLSDAAVANPAAGGDWNATDSWTLSSTGIGPAWGSIPFGNSVVILPGARINIVQSGRKTFINQIDGLLVLSSTKVGHSFGILRGTGTMRAPTATLPAGNYTAFVSAAGGTIEYVAPMTINNRNIYNNLSIIGTGSAVMTNTDLTLNGSVSIGATAVLNNSVNNRNITMAGGWTTATGGSFSAGTGTVTFNGTPIANISGVNTFNNLTVAKTGGTPLVSLAGLSGSTTVNNTLTLTSGNILSTATNTLTLPLAATINGGSANSFIAGPVRKTLAGSSSFTFPLGSLAGSVYRPAILGSTTGADTWTAQYVNADPSSSGFNHNSIALSSLIKKVSMFEYWLISRLGATVADLTITYNTGSYIPNVTNIGTVANLRVMRWNGTQWDFPPGGGTHTPVGSTVTGTVRVTNVTNFSPFTFGSFDDDSPLPVKWGPFEAERVNSNVELRWVVFQEVNNDHFEIERSQDGQEFSYIGSVPGKGNTNVKQEYKFVDTEASTRHKYYYRLRQVDYDGAADYSKVVSVASSEESSRFWIAYPNPMERDNKFTLEQTDETAISGEVTAVLYSAQGVLIYQGKGTLEEINTQVDGVLHSTSAGVYLLQISNGLTTENFRMVRH